MLIQMGNGIIGGKRAAGAGWIVLAGLAVLPGPAAGAVRKPAAARLGRGEEFTAKATPERLARGRYLVEAVANCFDCHSEKIYVDGKLNIRPGFKGAGRIWPKGEVPGPPGAVIVAPNITPDRETGIGRWSDADIERALREGVAKGGRPLFGLMPYWQFRVMTDEDVKSIIVFLRTIPAVHNALPTTKMPFPLHVDMHPELVPPLAKDAPMQVRRGWYLTRVAGCEDCHTPVLANGHRPPSMMFAGGLHFHDGPLDVFSTNITPDPSGISFMDLAMFLRTLRSGHVNGAGRELSPVMPTQFYRQMTTADLTDIYEYLRTVRPVHHEIDNIAARSYCKVDHEKHGLGGLN